MKMKVMYCAKSRKDGSYNTVVFDTDSKVFSSRAGDGHCIFVEARMSRDVDSLREALIGQGYSETDAA